MSPLSEQSIQLLVDLLIARAVFVSVAASRRFDLWLSPAGRESLRAPYWNSLALVDREVSLICIPDTFSFRADAVGPGHTEAGSGSADSPHHELAGHSWVSRLVPLFLKRERDHCGRPIFTGPDLSTTLFLV